MGQSARGRTSTSRVAGMRNISKIRHLLDRRTTTNLAHAYITSRLDNAKALLFGLPATILFRLQRGQNAAGRLVQLTGRRNHIIWVIPGLHWLPVRHRVVFKVLPLTYKALHGLAPSYMANLLSWCRPTRSLRSSDSLLLTVPRSRFRTFGDRASASSVPRL